MKLAVCSVFLNPYGVGIAVATEEGKISYEVQELIYSPKVSKNFVNQTVQELQNKYINKVVKRSRINKKYFSLTDFESYAEELNAYTETGGSFDSIGCNLDIDNDFEYTHFNLEDVNSEIVKLKMAINDDVITFSDKEKAQKLLQDKFDVEDGNSESYVLVSSLFLINQCIKELSNSVLWYRAL